jgi:holin-like protein
MKILLQIAFIFGICVVGDMISAVLPFTFPGSILAMVILLLLLILRAVKPSQLDETGGFLSKNMAFFFIPANVSVMEHFDIIKPVIIQILFISIVSMLATFAVAAYSAELTITIQRKIESLKTKKTNHSIAGQAHDTPATLEDDKK